MENKLQKISVISQSNENVKKRYSSRDVTEVYSEEYSPKINSASQNYENSSSAKHQSASGDSISLYDVSRQRRLTLPQPVPVVTTTTTKTLPNVNAPSFRPAGFKPMNRMFVDDVELNERRKVKRVSNVGASKRVDNDGTNLTTLSGDSKDLSTSANFLSCFPTEMLSPISTFQMDCNENVEYLSKENMKAIIAFAIEGSKSAERVATTHAKRPYFKNLESLCGRLKQDCVHSDQLLSNINSQGIPWAIKDMIYVYCRLFNAWIVGKDYVYSSDEGLRKIKAELSPGFVENFKKFESAAVLLARELLETMHNFEKTHRAQIMTKSSLAIKNEDRNDNSNYKENPSNKLAAKNSEEIQLLPENDNASCLKTGLYQPVQYADVNELQSLDDSHYSYSSNYSNDFKTDFKPQPHVKEMVDEKHHNANTVILDAHNHNNEMLFNKAFEQMTIDQSNGDAKANTTVSSSEAILWPTTFKVERGALDPSVISSELHQDNKVKVKYVMQELMRSKGVDKLFKKMFIENYFPSLVSEFLDGVPDLQQILIRSNSECYEHVYELLDDLKLLTDACKSYIIRYEHAALAEIVLTIENNLDYILSQHPFEQYCFEEPEFKEAPSISNFLQSFH